MKFHWWYVAAAAVAGVAVAGVAAAVLAVVVAGDYLTKQICKKILKEKK